MRLANLALKESFLFELCLGLHFRPVRETGIPAAAALRSEVQEVPHRREQIDAALFDVGRHPGMRSVKVMHSTVRASRENRDSRVLCAVAIFTAKVIFKCVVAGAKQAQLVPSALAGE